MSEGWHYQLTQCNNMGDFTVTSLPNGDFEVVTFKYYKARIQPLSFEPLIFDINKLKVIDIKQNKKDIDNE